MDDGSAGRGGNQVQEIDVFHQCDSSAALIGSFSGDNSVRGRLFFEKGIIWALLLVSFATLLRCPAGNCLQPGALFLFSGIICLFSGRQDIIRWSAAGMNDKTANTALGTGVKLGRLDYISKNPGIILECDPLVAGMKVGHRCAGYYGQHNNYKHHLEDCKTPSNCECFS